MIRYILHHIDADGNCAGAIIGRATTETKPNAIKYIPVDFGLSSPWEDLENVTQDDEIWLVDFSFDESDMLKMIRKVAPNRFFWIDHHKTAINALKDLEQKAGHPILGIRDESAAACMLTWRFCHKDIEPPLAVTYISDRDIWAFEHGNVSKYFHEMYRLENDSSPESPLWDRFFSMTQTDYQTYLKQGELLYTARMKNLKEVAKRLGREETMESTNGPLKILKLNYPGNGDLGQLINDMGYDIAWCYHERNGDGVLKRFTSLYSETVNVGEIARSRGGGGHAGSAGFREKLKHDRLSEGCNSELR